MQPAKLNNEYFKVLQSELRISIQLAASALHLGCVPKSIMVETGTHAPTPTAIYFYLAVTVHAQHILFQVLPLNLE
jgi:hypothetical protein